MSIKHLLCNDKNFNRLNYDNTYKIQNRIYWPIKKVGYGNNGRGIFVPYISNVNNLTSDIKLSLSKMKVGQKFYIDTIKVQTPTGIIILPATQIKIRA